MKNISYLILSLFFCLSCNKTNQKTTEVETKLPEMTVVKTHKTLSKISPKYYSKLKKWTYYLELERFLNRYTNTSASEALDNSGELKTIIHDIKENEIPKFLKTNSLISRLNVLENEILRLYDMSKISAIKASAVHQQINKIITIFNSLILKINFTLKQDELEHEIDLKDFFKLNKESKTTELEELKNKKR